MEIIIKHQEDKLEFKFRVKNADKLTQAEVIQICFKMNVKAIFVNGKYYSL